MRKCASICKSWQYVFGMFIKENENMYKLPSIRNKQFEICMTLMWYLLTHSYKPSKNDIDSLHRFVFPCSQYLQPSKIHLKYAAIAIRANTKIPVMWWYMYMVCSPWMFHNPLLQSLQPVIPRLFSAFGLATSLHPFFALARSAR